MRTNQNSKKWRLFAFLGVGVLVFHFAMVLVYVYNTNTTSNTFLHYNQKYMVPMFHQKWPLFAPDPAGYDCTLLGRYYTNNQWSHWKTTDLMTQEHFKLQHLEATLTADLTGLVYSNQGVYYVDSIPQFDRLERGFFYVQSYYYMNQYFKQYHGVVSDSIQLRLDYAFPPDFYSGQIQDSIQFTLNAVPTYGK